MRDSIQVGYQVFVAGSVEEIGAVRHVYDTAPNAFVVWVENAGDFTVQLDAVENVTSQKVILSPDKLDPRMIEAIAHAHDAEQPNV